MIEFINKDIFEAFDNNEFNVLCHQENCEGLNYFVGIAKIIHKKYPQLTKKHIDFCYQDDMGDIFGNILPYKIDDNKYVVNLYAQILRGSPRKFPPINKITIINKDVDDISFQEKSYVESKNNKI